MALLNWFRSLRTKTHRHNTPRPRTRLCVEQLEVREVPAVDFHSALGLGAVNTSSESTSSANDVAVDAVGNTYMTGGFKGTVDFDPNNSLPGDADVLTSTEASSGYVAKYAPDNSLIWVRQMGGSAIAVDGAGNVIVAGGFTGTKNFGSFTLTSAGDLDGFVAKLNSTGTVLWANRWGGTLSDMGRAVAVDGAGNVYVAGARVDPPGPVSGNVSGFEVLKFSASGSASWSQSQFIATGKGWLSPDLAVDAAGNVFVGGAFYGTVDFNPAAGSNNVYNVSAGNQTTGFVLKLTSAGAFGWVSRFASQYVNSIYGTSFVTSISLDGSGNVIVAGSYYGPVDFNPGSGTTLLPAVGGGFITKLNNNGSLVWAKALEKIGTASVSVLFSGLAVDAAGNIYASGALSTASSGGGTVDFDPGPGTFTRTAGPWSDVFVMKLTSAGNFAWAETFGGTGYDFSNGIAVDPSGTVTIVGSANSEVDFDPDPIDTYYLTSPSGKLHSYFVKLISENDQALISISDVSKVEGKKNTTTVFTFTVTLAQASSEVVTMSYQTVNGTATTANSDYVAKTGTITFNPGETTKTISITVNGDSKAEGDELFYVDLFGNSSNSLFAKNRGIGTILNDD